ncbi:hypothetical protein Tco_0093118 [Tanacetum coccineum]
MTLKVFLAFDRKNPGTIERWRTMVWITEEIGEQRNKLERVKEEKKEEQENQDDKLNSKKEYEDIRRIEVSDEEVNMELFNRCLIREVFKNIAALHGRIIGTSNFGMEGNQNMLVSKVQLYTWNKGLISEKLVVKFLEKEYKVNVVEEIEDIMEVEWEEEDDDSKDEDTESKEQEKMTLNDVVFGQATMVVGIERKTKSRGLGINGLVKTSIDRAQLEDINGPVDIGINNCDGLCNTSKDGQKDQRSKRKLKHARKEASVDETKEEHKDVDRAKGGKRREWSVESCTRNRANKKKRAVDVEQEETHIGDNTKGVLTDRVDDEFEKENGEIAFKVGMDDVIGNGKKRSVE